MKRFLILQLRPESDASDDEYNSILDKCGLNGREADGFSFKKLHDQWMQTLWKAPLKQETSCFSGKADL